MSFLTNCELFGLVSILSDAILTFLIKFCFFKTDVKFFDVIIHCCCCLILLFVLTRFLNIGITLQSNASLFTPLSYLLWSLSFRSYTNY